MNVPLSFMISADEPGVDPAHSRDPGRSGDVAGSATFCLAYSHETFPAGSHEMNFVTKTLIAGLVLVAGAAFAAEATDPTVKARQELMDTIGANAKILGEMAGEKTAFDAAAAEAAKAAIVAAVAEIPVKFEPQATDPKSTAKPDVWTSWDAFLTKASALGTAAGALDATTLDGVKAGMAGVGGACKDCHTTYRM
jgi:cytochrome c556